MAKKMTKKKRKAARKVKLGRPRLLTPSLHREIVKLIEDNCPRRAAAAQAGIGKSTLQTWLKRGRDEPTGIYRDFATDIERAEAVVQHEAAKRVNDAGKRGCWQADAWQLERRWPDVWGRWDRVTHETEEPNDEARDVIRNKEVRELLDRAAEQAALEGDAGSDGDDA